MRETCTSGLKRAEAAGYTAPPLLDWLNFAFLRGHHPWLILRFFRGHHPWLILHHLCGHHLWLILHFFRGHHLLRWQKFDNRVLHEPELERFEQHDESVVGWQLIAQGLLTRAEQDHGQKLTANFVGFLVHLAKRVEPVISQSIGVEDHGLGDRFAITLRLRWASPTSRA